MITWVTAQCGVSTSTARQWVRSGANLESLPCLAEGLALGELSLDKLEPLAEVASAESDAALREASSHWSVRQARELATWHRAHREAQEQAAAEAAEAGSSGDTEAVAVTASAAREFERRTLRFNDVRRSVWVAFTKDDYAAAKSALVNRVSARMRRRGDSSAEYVPFDQRLYDALMDLFAERSEPAAEARRGFRPQVIVHAPLEVLLGVGAAGRGRSGYSPGAEGVPEIAGVGPIEVEVARRLACDAEVVLSVEGRDGSILEQGRARRDPTTAQRIEIDRRDKGCRFPGCTYNEFTDVHHIKHWAEGGGTDSGNLLTLCGRHHNAVHELGWRMAGDANAEVRFTSPRGRLMTSVPSPTWPRAMRRQAVDRSPPDPPLRR